MKKTIMTSVVGLLFVLGLVGNIGIEKRGLHAESIKQENTSDLNNTKVKDIRTNKISLEKKEAKAERFKRKVKAAKKTTKTKAPSTSKPKITMEATAYTANCTGCSGITRTGINLKTNPNQKVIAVDPNIIPLGTKVYVEGYGTAIAGDTGGDIKGNRIDLFIPNRQDALNFGRRQVTVTVIG